MSQFQCAQASDKGRIRDLNENAVAICHPHARVFEDKGLFFLMADGLGGRADGDLASSKAITVMGALFNQMKIYGDDDWILNAIRSANQKIFILNQKREGNEKMGTGLTASLFYNGELHIGHVGSCRVYRIREGKIKLLTEDHTEDHHLLTRAVGIDEEIHVDVYKTDVKLQDTYVQCTDGLYEMVTDDEIYDIAANHEPIEACQKLIDLANSNGGVDNVTVQINRVKAEPENKPTT